MPFKRSSGPEALPSDPVQLYRTLAEANRGPESLWLHQGDVLRSWHTNYPNAADIAIELPTGAGKTLVGGLIGDYRRRVAKDRVAYLCPTRQLAKQTTERLLDYGVPAVLLTGKVSRWNPADRTRYTTANAVAVSVYSHVFNTNPALGDAQLLLLDDAHAAEGAVSSPWSLSIKRADEEATYLDVLSTLATAVDPLVVERLRTPSSSAQYRPTVYLASPAGVTTHAANLETVLTTASDAGGLNEDASYALRFLTGHLHKCLVYLSHGEILIRPLIPPTSTHVAFSGPARRIYMSATLGAGGELERIFGRRKITRIPIPEGWEKQGTGRRLFCFPQLTTDLAARPDLVDPWVAAQIAEHGRTLVLTPDHRTAKDFIAHRLPADYDVLNAADVEDDLKAFTSRTQAALVLANRYDGIDLPDQDCRLVVLDGLPARGDLQERFLYGSLGALEVLQERIRARIMQGAGRATRNAKDFSAVLILDPDLIAYINRGDVQDAMHPEIHAELVFGYKNSDDTTSHDMAENLRTFAAHSDDWRIVDRDIVEDREQYNRLDAPGAVELQRAVAYEVDAADAMWQGEWERALELIREVLDALRGGRAPQRYAALWNYLAACVARRLPDQPGTSAYSEVAGHYLAAARAAARGTTWLSHLASPADNENVTSQRAGLDPLNLAAMQGVLDTAAALAKPSRFDEEVQRARSGLLAAPHKPYEDALVIAGRLAGANPSLGNNNDSAAPDAMWIFPELLWVGWEAKSEAVPEGELGAGDVRQAGGHLRYTAQQRNEPIPSDSFVALTTPQKRVHPSARAVAEDHTYLVDRTTVLDLFDRLVRAWRKARSTNITSLPIEQLAAMFHAEGALPTQWIPNLRQHAIRAQS